MMAVGKQLVAAVLVGFGAASVGEADMMAVLPVREEGSCFVPQTCCSFALNPPTVSSLLGQSEIPDFYVWSTGLIPWSKPHAGGIEDAPPMWILADRHGSLYLCICGFLGAGLCGSAPWFRKLSAGLMPHWYHAGGPFQIGHSRAIAPDCLYSGPVALFIQPNPEAQSPAPRCSHGTSVIALWRSSQFTPAVRAARAPPSRCRLTAIRGQVLPVL